MALKLITAPAAEPVSLTTAKLHCRQDSTADDDLITALIKAAREYVEDFSGRALISQTWELAQDGFPWSDRLVIPMPPLVSITSIKYYDLAGTEATFASTNYIVDTYNEPGQVVLKSGASWPGVSLREVNGVITRFVCGYGAAAANVPAKYIQAMLLTIGHWYENRENIIATGAVPKEIPMGARALLWLDRVKVF